MPQRKDTTSTATAWLGAPPVTEDGFAYANGDFFAVASGHNQHRRATPAELNEHFSSGHDRDHPAHWFEAQSIHYGIKPSKTKSVARMRLHDAVKSGGLTVPTNISALESKLRKEWTKRDRETKKSFKTTATTKTEKKPTTAVKESTSGAKRKADDDANNTSTSSPSTSRRTKKIIIATHHNKSSKVYSKTQSSASSRVKPPTPTMTQDRRGRSPPQPRQTARRSRPFAGRGRILAPQPTVPCHDGDDNPYENYVDQSYSDSVNSDDDIDNDGYPPTYSDSEHDKVSYRKNIDLIPLTYIDGCYNITSPYLDENWSYRSDYNLVFTVSGSTLWACFDFGLVEGVMYFPALPAESSYDPVPFTWRGREAEGPIVYGDNNEGWMKFLGGGQIEGGLRYQDISFTGRRRPGPAIASPISAHTMQTRWNGYSEQEYRREEEARWF
ncbi:hypothetical protein BGZ63DRAFT_368518 [Mariannaea sp. PMI_226]|nr:hypothetical protein BGZ63DRAFT_368518 [Mariannaea sp. PMI_226]